MAQKSFDIAKHFISGNSLHIFFAQRASLTWFSSYLKIDRYLWEHNGPPRSPFTENTRTEAASIWDIFPSPEIPHFFLVGWSSVFWALSRSVFNIFSNTKKWYHQSLIGQYSVSGKHCQRHNGPEGWVLITSSKTNLDQISSSETRPSTNFKISTKHQPLHKI